jgi:hypothetical protein
MKKIIATLGLTAAALVASVLPAHAGIYGDDVVTGYFKSANCTPFNTIEKCDIVVRVQGTSYDKKVYVTHDARIRYCDSRGVRDMTTAQYAFSRNMLAGGSLITVIHVPQLQDPSSTKLGRVTCRN